MAKLRPGTRLDSNRIRSAIFDLRDAREKLHLAGAVKACAYVRRAIKSAEGAFRHAERRMMAAQRARHAPWCGARAGGPVCGCGKGAP